MFFYTSCVVYIRSFTVFKHFYKGWKNHYPVDSAIRPSYNRPQIPKQLIHNLNKDKSEHSKD
jgi:hypothetical protein